MAITPEEKSEWRVRAVRFPPSIDDALEQFIAEVGEERASSAIRTLIALGLKEKDLLPEGAIVAIRANVQAAVLEQVSALTEAYVEALKEGIDEVLSSEPDVMEL